MRTSIHHPEWSVKAAQAGEGSRRIQMNQKRSKADNRGIKEPQLCRRQLMCARLNFWKNVHVVSVR